MAGKKRILLILGICIILLSLGTCILVVNFALSDWGSDYATTDVTAEQLAECERIMTIDLPDSTVALGLWSVSWLDMYVGLKFRLPASDLPELIANSPFADTEFRTDWRPITNRDNLRWWNPDGVRRFKSAGATTTPPEGSLEGEGLHILIDLDDEEYAILYIVWFNIF